MERKRLRLRTSYRCHVERSAVETSNSVAAEIDSSTSLRFAQNDGELRPLKPLQSSGRPIIVILSGAQRSRRISLKPLPLVAARIIRRGSPRPLNYSQTTLRYSSPLPVLNGASQHNIKKLCPSLRRTQFEILLSDTLQQRIT